MRKTHLLILASVVLMQSVFADDAMTSSGSKPCAVIAKTCLNAGFSRKGNDNKKFWSDCMKPIILGKAVKGINVDSVTIKSCRIDKINALKKELNEFKNASS